MVLLKIVALVLGAGMVAAAYSTDVGPELVLAIVCCFS